MLRVAARIAVSRALSSVSRQTILAPLKVNAPAVPVRFFSPTPTAIQEVADRIFYILSLFDKIDQEKLALDCRFDKDLGLDSLDTTEIAMAVEDEFNLEIPVETMDLLLECFRANKFVRETKSIYSIGFTEINEIRELSKT